MECTVGASVLVDLRVVHDSCKSSMLKVANEHPSHMRVRQDITGHNKEQCCAVKAETERCGSGCWRSFRSRVLIKKLA